MELDPAKAGLVICITLFLVVGVNAAIYVGLARRRGIGQIEMLRRASDRARRPWEQEEKDLEELSRRVAALRRPGGDEDRENEPKP
jgi:hypothetical protein